MYQRSAVEKDRVWEVVQVMDTITPGNDRFTVITFAIVALLILAMACINFTNLATARASQRAREVALRKVLGFFTDLSFRLGHF